MFAQNISRDLHCVKFEGNVRTKATDCLREKQHALEHPRPHTSAWAQPPIAVRFRRQSVVLNIKWNTGTPFCAANALTRSLVSCPRPTDAVKFPMFVSAVAVARRCLTLESNDGILYLNIALPTAPATIPS